MAKGSFLSLPSMKAMFAVNALKNVITNVHKHIHMWIPYMAALENGNLGTCMYGKFKWQREFSFFTFYESNVCSECTKECHYKCTLTHTHVDTVHGCTGERYMCVWEIPY